MEENTKLIPIPENLPEVPFDSGKRTLTWYDGTVKTFDTIAEFDEWFKNADYNEYSDEIEVPDGVDKDGNEKTKRVVQVSNAFFANALAMRYLPISYAKQPYIFSPKTMTYSRDTGEMAAWVRGQVQYAVFDGYLHKTTKIEPIVREVVNQASGMNVIGLDLFPFNMYNGFPANNCVIVFNDDATISVEKYRPDMMYTRKSPINYNPHASTEKAERILKTWLPGTDDDGRELWEYLVQIPAQMVYQSLPGITPMKLAYMLVGEHDSGRSTYNEALQDFFGKNNMSTLSLQEFSDKYAGGDLVEKFGNMGDDITTMRIGEGNKFKQYVGIEYMSIERKYQDKYNARITAVHTYSANNLPRLDEEIYADEAWWSRWVILKWTNHFARDASWKKNNLDAEFYEGLFLLVIGEVCKIIKNRGLVLTQDPSYVKTEWLSSETKLHEFVMQSVEYKKGKYIDGKCMLDALNDWADNYMPAPSFMTSEFERREWRKNQKLMLPSTPKALTQALKKEGIGTRQIKVKSLDPSKNYDQPTVYTGVCWKDYTPWAREPDYKDRVVSTEETPQEGVKQ